MASHHSGSVVSSSPHHSRTKLQWRPDWKGTIYRNYCTIKRNCNLVFMLPPTPPPPTPWLYQEKETRFQASFCTVFPEGIVTFYDNFPPLFNSTSFNRSSKIFFYRRCFARPCSYLHPELEAPTLLWSIWLSLFAHWFLQNKYMADNVIWSRKMWRIWWHIFPRP